MIALLLAPGFEETEAVVPLDILRRAGLDVVTVAVGQNPVPGAHNIAVVADMALESLNTLPDMLILPGGYPGVKHLEESPRVHALIDDMAEKQKPIAAICAAPAILARKGLLRGRRAVCFPGMEAELLAGGTVVLENEKVVADGPFLTAQAAGAALEFGFAIVSALKGADAAKELREKMYV